MKGRIGRSLTGALYVRTLLLVAVTGMLMAGVLFAIVRADINQRADQQLIIATHVLHLLMREEFTGDDPKSQVSHDNPYRRLLSDEDLSAFRASAAWRQFAVYHFGILTVPPTRGDVGKGVAAIPGFRTFGVGSDKWRSYGLAVPEQRLLIVVAEPMQARAGLILRVGEQLIGPIMLLILGSAVLLWLTLRRGLSAVQQLSAMLGSRSAAELKPLHLHTMPSDLAPIVAALNGLLARVRAAIEHEQAFADHAAHQLRTPLAALKLRAQLLLRRASPDSEEHAALSDLLESVDRGSDTITQMLQLARLDATALTREPVDLRELASEVIADRALFAARAGADFSLTAPDIAIASTDPTPLRVALATIIDNAVEHAASGGTIDVEIRPVSGRLALVVSDRGPGMHPERLSGAAGRDGDPRPGGGLGLAIARRAVTVLGGELRLENRSDGPGLRATIFLPD
ncbi:sensor histidine kinase [Sphingomonas sp. NPDC092331]|jgi:signal transduction histidine kinase|uniref:sensor histidine kinase n=1 Tax=unclassified Sphingomonas TaxID=196159 RepID=UPI0029EFA905|nr:ATP-binding protein [Pseudomonadota bacterium]